MKLRIVWSDASIATIDFNEGKAIYNVSHSDIDAEELDESLINNLSLKFKIHSLSRWIFFLCIMWFG
jgi:hypothetical protein